MHVVFCSSEVYPFAKTGGLGDVAGALPLALSKLGVKVDIFLPDYSAIVHTTEPQVVSENMRTVSLDDNVRIFFVTHDGYFGREGFYGDSSGDYKDNLERFNFFCTSVLDYLDAQKVSPDIVHCHDWQAALIPVYLKTRYQNSETFKKTKSVLTIHNLVFQGVFDESEFADLGFSADISVLESFRFHGRMNLLKSGIIHADKVNTVSPQYAKEILTEQFGAGLSEVTASRPDGIMGILNGLDYTVWSPENDVLLTYPFTLDNFEVGKAKNRKALIKKLDLPENEAKPLFGFVGRLSHQKGVELIIDTLPSLLAMPCQIVIQGVGEEKYQDKLKQIAAEHSDQLVVITEFDERLAHEIYAGCDMFLMPSNFEPCGLSQLISMAYATIPVVFKTGGLADTVVTYEDVVDNANGFVFEDYTVKGFVKILEQAMVVFKDKARWNVLCTNAMNADFSWERSAAQYKELYQCLLSD